MSIKQQVKEFWTYFLKNQNDIEQALLGKNEKDIKKWSDRLGDLCVKLAGCYLSLSIEDDFFMLTFEPGKDKTSQIVSLYLKKFAPHSLSDKWMIFDCIPPLSEKIYHYRFQVEGVDYTIDDLEVAFSETPKVKDSFSVLVYCKAFEKMNINETEVISETFVQNILGDVILNCYVEKVEASSVKKDELKYVKMRDAYDEIIEFMDVHEYATYSDSTQIYSIYKLNEDQISDDVLKDRILISTIQPIHFVEVMNHERTSLNQVSRLGGEVGFLVLEIEQFNEEEAKRKRVLEKELNDLLYSLGIARVCGSSIANRRIYFEVFIFDKEEFKKAIVHVVSKLKLPMTYVAY